MSRRRRRDDPTTQIGRIFVSNMSTQSYVNALQRRLNAHTLTASNRLCKWHQVEVPPSTTQLSSCAISAPFGSGIQCPLCDNEATHPLYTNPSPSTPWVLVCESCAEEIVKTS